MSFNFLYNNCFLIPTCLQPMLCYSSMILHVFYAFFSVHSSFKGRAIDLSGHFHHLSSRFVCSRNSFPSLAFCFLFLFSSQVISFVFKLLLMRFLRCRIIDRPPFWQRRATIHRFLTNIFAVILTSSTACCNFEEQSLQFFRTPLRFQSFWMDCCKISSIDFFFELT